MEIAFSLLPWWLFLVTICIADKLNSGEKYKCGVELNGTCIAKIKWNIPERYADEGRPFTLFCTSTEGKTEKAAVLYFWGYYRCEAAGGHICDDSTSTNLTGISVTTCVIGAEYTLAADGELGVSCTVLPTQSHRNTHGQNETKSYSNSHLTSKKMILGSVTGVVALSIIAATSVFLLVRWRLPNSKVKKTKS